MPMVGLCLLSRVTIAKVDISLLLGSPDEEEEVKTSTTSGSSRGSIAPEAVVASSLSQQLPNIPEEPSDTPTTTTASVPAKRRQSDQPAGQPSSKKQLKWSAEEDALIIELRGRGMKWEDISKRLPGRSGISCRLHYQNYLERRSEWDEEKKNKLARLYERFKSEMWSKIAEEMAIPWRAAEAMHWQIGEQEMATRAGVAPFYLSGPSTDQARRTRRRSIQPTGTRRETPRRSIHDQLPSVAELTAGVPAFVPQLQSPQDTNHHTRSRTRSRTRG